ncbi:hypothetical protein PHAVU_002G096100 [Phaseolus vulgaris]|uniref:PGG domain-containing protein n=1 Tax=Phaseolus vulgaris TaxID=3885 RepID=V7CLJ2_PHAVU|nr:hypothetical protein PHAVU_002G096100g [Phaseolus vulgaris]ESW29751.1 hypothetical protein PHAVU_002G096100g [Phaseolus vulgaris]
MENEFYNETRDINYMITFIDQEPKSIVKDENGSSSKIILLQKQAITNYLPRNPANPFVQDKKGATSMHYAVLTASSQSIKILLLYNMLKVATICLKTSNFRTFFLFGFN